MSGFTFYINDCKADKHYSMVVWYAEGATDGQAGSFTNIPNTVSQILLCCTLMVFLYNEVNHNCKEEQYEQAKR